jgi:hypothetical protein
VCHCRVVEQEGQGPEVGRIEGVAVSVFPVVVEVDVLVSDARKCVARQVRCVIAVQVCEGQRTVLAPEAGRRRVQSVQWRMRFEVRRAVDFARAGLKGLWVTSRAWMPFSGASVSVSGGGGAEVFLLPLDVADTMPSAIPTQSPFLNPFPPSSSKCCAIQRLQTRKTSSA